MVVECLAKNTHSEAKKLPAVENEEAAEARRRTVRTAENIADPLYEGPAGTTGEALAWQVAIGADLAHLDERSAAFP